MGTGANAYALGASLAASTGYAVALPHLCTEVTVVNDGAIDVHVDLGSTAVSTGSWYLKPGEAQTWRLPIDTLSLMATATACCRVGAWRY